MTPAPRLSSFFACSHSSSGWFSLLSTLSLVAYGELQSGVIHRDLKANNVFIKARDPLTLAVGDFGLSHVWASEGSAGPVGTACVCSLTLSSPLAPMNARRWIVVVHVGSLGAYLQYSWGWQAVPATRDVG